jgi:BlaI family transcriptional regulator, penicillinase repressor
MNPDLESFILTRRELQIMRVIWDKESVTVKEVHDAIIPVKTMARNTILTMIRILEQKGALTHQKAGRAFIYIPVLSRHQATMNQIRDIIHRFFDDKPEKLIEIVIKNEIKDSEKLEVAKALVESRLLPVMAMKMTASQAQVAAP